MSNKTFSAVIARQSDSHQVLSIVATADEILEFATIDRIGRDEKRASERLSVAADCRPHKRDSRLSREGGFSFANPIVVAFTDGITITSKGWRHGRGLIELSKGPPGLFGRRSASA